MINYLIGDGMPSSVTPNRVKKILAFAKSQEREFKDALDRNGDPLWTTDLIKPGFYERLQLLLTTKYGRIVYDNARKRFEESKPKRTGRANFFKRLEQNCLHSLSDNKPSSPSKYDLQPTNDNLDDRTTEFARKGEWKLMSEYIWAKCVIAQSGDDLANAIDKYPKLTEFLSAVTINQISKIDDSVVTAAAQSMDEKSGEVEQLIEAIAQAINSVNPNQLELHLLVEIGTKLNRLSIIAEKRNIINQNTFALSSKISDWKKRNFKVLSGIHEIESRFNLLESSAANPNFLLDNVDSILKKFQRYIDISMRITEKTAQHSRTLSNSKFLNQILDESETFLSEMNALKATCSQLLDEVDAELRSFNITKTPSDGLTHTDHEHADAYSFTGVSGTSLEPDLQKRVDESAPSRNLKASKIDANVDNSNELQSDDDASTKASQRDSDVPHSTSSTSNGNDKSLSSMIKSAEAEMDYNAILADMLTHERFAIAYHLARASHVNFPTSNVVCLVASNFVTRDIDTIAGDYPDLADQVRDDLHKAFARGSTLDGFSEFAPLVSSAALQPARISLGGPVAQLLQLLEPHLRDQHSYRQIVKKAMQFSLGGFPLHSLSILDDNAEEQWKSQFYKLYDETDIWLTAARRATIKFRAASDVWRRALDVWEMDDRVSLGFLLKISKPSSRAAKSFKKSDSEKIKRCTALWRRNFEREIDRIDRECRSTPRFRPIEGAARRSLQIKIFEALTLVDQWLAIRESRPSSSSTHYLKEVEGLQMVINEHHRNALEELSNLEPGYRDLTCRLFRRYLSFFGVSDDEPLRYELGLADLLHGELLGDESIEFDDDYDEPTTNLSVHKILSLARRKSLDFKKSAIFRAQSHDFAIAERTIDFAFRRRILSEQAADSIRRAVDDQRKQSLEELDKKVSAVHSRLGAVYARGVISTDEFEEFRTAVPSYPPSLDYGISKHFKELNEIEQNIDIVENECVEKLRKRTSATLFSNVNDKERVESAISNGRFLVAEDFLDCVARGENLPKHEITKRQCFDRFFPSFVDEYFEFRKRYDQPIEKIREIFERRAQLGPIDAKALSKNSYSDNVKVLDAWQGLFRDLRAIGRLRTFFESLGFYNPEITRDSVFTQLKINPIKDRTVVQIPEFGSGAAGLYKILGIRNRTSSEAILRGLDAIPREVSSPVIVLFLGCLDSSGRKYIAQQFSCGRYGLPLVLDEALVVFLSLEHDSKRLRAFFDCASAFSFALPYNPDAVKVPHEMFFGRADARQRIQSHSDSSHLVFGGRRLGKTALLNSIVSDTDVRTKDELVVYFDLKGEGIGQPKLVGDIWHILADRLTSNITNLKGVQRIDLVRSRIKTWIKAKPRRRILTLFDEADVFLESDRRQDYRVLSQFKDLMDQTDRRFKVVFSGLHNVQRFSTDRNSPLAHLGDPIQIGPMLPSADGSPIEQLIRQPLEALGFRFISNDDVTYIAMETNYYPALAQQFCKVLLSHLRESLILSQTDGPPYLIPSDTIRSVFDLKETRDRLRNIFSWTIQLDPRYEFLTFLIAQQGLIDPDTQTLGVALPDIREIALAEWRQGFVTDSSYKTFEALLEEMIGLGVLREKFSGDGSRDRHFAIRTHSFRVLLGNDAEVRRRYEDSKRAEVPKSEPASFRRTIGDNKLSVLTAAQEENLLFDQLGVALVFGTALSGIWSIEQSLRQATRELDGAPRLEVVQSGSLLTRLKTINKNSNQDNVLLAVNLDNSWNLKLIREAFVRIKKIDVKAIRFRVVFICNSLCAWNWLNEEDFEVFLGLRTIWLSQCSVEFAHLWLKDREIEAYRDLHDPINVTCTPWPTVVSIAAESKQRRLADAAIEMLERDPSIVNDVLEAPHANAVLRTLFEVSPATIDDIRDWMTELAKERGASIERQHSIDEIRKIINWAMHLGAVNKVGKRYSLDSVYSLGIKAALKT